MMTFISIHFKLDRGKELKFKKEIKPDEALIAGICSVTINDCFELFDFKLSKGMNDIQNAESLILMVSDYLCNHKCCKLMKYLFPCLYTSIYLFHVPTV